MPISEEIKEIVACENLRCPECGKKVVSAIIGNDKRGWYLSLTCGACGWKNAGSDYGKEVK